MAGAGFGVSGFDWPSEREPTLRAIGELRLNAPLALGNDALIGLIAGAPEGWGVAVVAGTGCNCWGRDRHHNIGRMTGMGPAAGEAAGATELVEEAVRRIARAWTQRSPATRLTEAFLKSTGAVSAQDFLEGLSQDRYHVNASAAPVVFEVAAEGDVVAREVIEWAGRELGSLAIGVIRQLGFESMPFDVIMVGSLFDGGSRLIDPMQATIRQVAPRARFVRLSVPPVVGGVLLAVEQTRQDPATIRVALIQSVSQFVERLPNTAWAAK
jgi:N-acetylglucosamine kinase-like BadF-type ATPase